MTIALIALAAFLSGSAIGILAIIVAGIRSDDRSKKLTRTPRTAAEAITRRVSESASAQPDPAAAKTASPIVPAPPRKRSDMTVPIPLATLTGAGTSRTSPAT